MTQNRDVMGTSEKFESSSPHHSHRAEAEYRATRSAKQARNGKLASGYSGDTLGVPEVWRLCADHPQFEVSDLGRVRRAKTGRLLAQATARGYKRVTLTSGVRPRRARVHRLVAMAFIPNDRPEAGYVNHIDGDKTNNRVENLEWCTPLENARHAVALGLQPNGEAHGASKLKVEHVHRIRSMRSEGYTLRGIAAAIGISDTAVFRILSGKTWTRA